MRLPILFVVLAVSAGAAAGETLYKLVAPDGKVTYSQEAPKNFDGKVIKLEIDPNANTSDGRPVPKKIEKPRTNQEILQSSPRAAQDDKIAIAKEKLETAKRKYEQLRDNPGPDDVQRVGSKGGGARPVFSEDYAGRLSKLEADVKKAQEELDALERGR